MTINKTTKYVTEPNTIPVDTTTGSQNLSDALNQRTPYFKTLQELKDATSLSVGDVVHVLGRNSISDSGGNVYEIVAASTGTNDGGSYIDLSGSGLQAKGLFFNGHANPLQFGARGDGSLVSQDVTDETSSMQACINYAIQEGLKVLVPNGIYTVNSLTVDGGSNRPVVEIVGESQNTDLIGPKEGGAIIELADNSNGSLFEVGTSIGQCHFRNLYIRGRQDFQTGTSYAIHYLGDVSSARSGDIQNCFIRFFLSGGVYYGANRNSGLIDRTIIINCGVDGTSVADGVKYDSVFDCRINLSDIGSNTGNGVEIVAGDGFRIVSSDLFRNKEAGLKAITGPQVIKCTDVKFDLNEEENLVLEGSSITRPQTSPHMFNGCVFHGGGGLGVSSSIRLENDRGTIFTGCGFELASWEDDSSVQVPFYILQLNGSSENVQWLGNNVFTNVSVGVVGNIDTSTIPVGSTTEFTVDVDPTTEFRTGALVTMNSQTSPGNYIFGRVTARTATTVTVYVLKKGGSNVVSDYQLCARRPFIKDVFSDSTKINFSDVQTIY